MDVCGLGGTGNLCIRSRLILREVDWLIANTDLPRGVLFLRHVTGVSILVLWNDISTTLL